MKRVIIIFSLILASLTTGAQVSRSRIIDEFSTLSNLSADLSLTEFENGFITDTMLLVSFHNGWSTPAEYFKAGAIAFTGNEIDEFVLTMNQFLTINPSRGERLKYNGDEWSIQKEGRKFIFYDFRNSASLAVGPGPVKKLLAWIERNT